MKTRTKLLTLLMVFMAGMAVNSVHVSANEGVKIDKTNIPDITLRTMVEKDFDKNKDGYLQKEESDSVKKINFYKFLDPDDFPEDATVIKYKKEDFEFDCKGLAYFGNLEDLTLNFSGGVSIDGKVYPVKVQNFSEIYKLNKLTNLSIYKADIKMIDISKFKKLKKLKLSNFGQLTKIKFKGNSNLSTLRLDTMKKLKIVDVTSLKNLKTLYMLDVDAQTVKFGKNNKKLKDLYINGYGSSKKLKQINLNALTGIKKLVLEKVNVAKLDLSKNKKLKEIYIDSCNKLKTLNLEKNKALTWVACEGKKTTKIILPKNNKIETFKWVYAGLKKFDVKRLNPKKLDTLILFGNKIKKIDVKPYKKLTLVRVDKNTKVVVGKGQKVEISR